MKEVTNAGLLCGIMAYDIIYRRGFRSVRYLEVKLY